MPISHDFSDFPDDLFTLAIDQMTFGDVLEYDLPSRVLREAQDANARREALLAKDRYAYWDLWMRFAAGVENLLKAVFLRHQIFLIRKRHLLTKAPGGSKALSTPAAADVYRAVASVQLAVATNQWLQAQFAAAGIQHPLEIDTGTLGSNRKELPRLETAGKMTPAEARQLSDSIQVLEDIRRNVDAHVFLKAQTGGSFQNDLTTVYLPAVNLLIDVFHR